MMRPVSSLLLLSGLLVAPAALAEGAGAPKPPPYSLPWQLRPIAPANVVRLDLPVASHEGGSTYAPVLTGGYAVTPEFGALARVGYVSTAPDEGAGASGFTNPLIGALYSPKLGGELKLALFAGVALPLGSGGGNDPDPKSRIGAGVLARSALDNALFAVNDLVPLAGVDVAWVSGGFTLQAEATVLELLRMRGEDVQKDKTKTNSTAGLHAGYFFIPQLSIGLELRHQRWLSTPSFLKGAPSENRDNTTAAAGLRGHVAAGDVKLKPGLAYVMPLDDPMKEGKYGIVFADVPVIF
ncbi:MAG: hypothetical protein IT376_17410 [Polyangiaceae bacterium]|nr:hypothetical protein [Polyangiaceae bacterium]